jgi:CHAD domain-containing protein
LTEPGAESAELLERPPEEGARRLALSHLDQVMAALPRLHDAADAEALHDLRVALRRLRSCCRSYAVQLGDAVPHKVLRRLRDLTRETSAGRDAEVQIEWLRGQRGALAGHHRQALTGLLERLAARRAAAYDSLRGEVGRDLTELEAALRPRLAVYQAEVRLDGGELPRFGDAAAGLLGEHAAKLDRSLDRIEGPADVERAHAARISAKRLRYLAEPLVRMAQAARLGGSRAWTPAAAPEPAAEPQPSEAIAAGLVPALKELQDLLGELHDAHVLEAELSAALGEMAVHRAGRLLELTLEGEAGDERRLRAERRRPHEPGLLALARLNRARRDRLYAELTGAGQGGRRTRLLQATAELSAALREGAHRNATAAPA